MVLLEILDSSGFPVAEGEFGDIVVTNLDNFAMPLIRHANGEGTCRTERQGRVSRKYYAITAKGREGLAVARARLRELKGEAGTG